MHSRLLVNATKKQRKSTHVAADGVCESIRFMTGHAPRARSAWPWPQLTSYALGFVICMGVLFLLARHLH